MVATGGRGMATRSSQVVAKTRGFKNRVFFFEEMGLLSVLSIDHDHKVENN